jgi:hypothetical protein
MANEAAEGDITYVPDYIKMEPGTTKVRVGFWAGLQLIFYRCEWTEEQGQDSVLIAPADMVSYNKDPSKMRSLSEGRVCEIL